MTAPSGKSIRAGAPAPGRRILVLRGGALGDFIVTLPALVALQEHWPDARVELVGNAVAAELARSRGIVAAVHSQHEARWSALFANSDLPREFAAWLREFDVVINFWPDSDGALAAHFPVTVAQRFLAAPALPSSEPAAAHFSAALAPLGINTNSVFVRLRASTPSRQRRNSPARVVIHPGSGSRPKNWPRERWFELISILRKPTIVLVGAAESDEWTDAKLQRTPISARLADGSVQLLANAPLEQLVELLGEVDLFVGHDSGISHLAAASGAPSLLLFGPTDPKIWAPPAPHVTVLRNGSDLRSIGVAEVEQAACAALTAGSGAT